MFVFQAEVVANKVNYGQVYFLADWFGSDWRPRFFGPENNNASFAEMYNIDALAKSTSGFKTVTQMCMHPFLFSPLFSFNRPYVLYLLLRILLIQDERVDLPSFFKDTI